METIKVKFAFKIGDEVVFKGTIDRKRIKFSSFAKKEGKDEIVSPQLFRITDRNYEECYGGSQNHYSLRILLVNEDGYSLNQDACGIVAPNGNLLTKAREHELEKAKQSK